MSNDESFGKDAENVDNSRKAKLTDNSLGVMFEFDDPNMLESIDFIDKSKPVADLGVAYGHSTKTLLNNGFRVIANDLSETMLNSLWNDVSDEQKKMLTLMPGDVAELCLGKETLSAVIALRFFHFFTGEQIRKLLKKFYEWLMPGGVLVLTSRSPFNTASFMNMSTYSDDAGSLEWPGETRILKRADDVFCKHCPDYLNFLSVDVLVREVNLAGFQVFKSANFGRKLTEKTFTKFGSDRDNYSSVIAVKDMMQFLKKN